MYKWESASKYINRVKLPREFKRAFFGKTHGATFLFMGSCVKMYDVTNVLKVLRVNDKKLKRYRFSKTNLLTAVVLISKLIRIAEVIMFNRSLKFLIHGICIYMAVDTFIQAEEYFLPKGTQTFYESGIEKERLEKGTGSLEKLRTEKILEQFLPCPPAIILDVGGGVGVYTFHLAKRGYGVYLIDPVAYHIEEAKKIGKMVTGNAPLGYIVGDARKIEMNEGSADVVLFFGPLYHLNQADRKLALSEAYRVLKQGGSLFAVGVSKYAPLDSYFKKGKMTPDLKASIFDSLMKGQFEYRGAVFYSHYPTELRREVEQAGFKEVSLHAVEGLGSLVTNENIQDRVVFDDFMRIIEASAQDESVLGISSHIMAIGKK